MVEVLCESCGKEFRAKNLNVRQCPEHVGHQVVQDIVSVIKGASDQFIYDLKAQATLDLRTLKGDKFEQWRTVKACDRVLVARELPLVQVDTLTRIKNITERKLVHR